jgi:PKD repeat protein
VTSPDAASISSIVLMRPGSPTHAYDMEQRLVGLSFSAAGTTLTVSGPPNANIAPPGYYMLFILNNRGVPSIAKFVQVLSTANNQPPSGTITQPTGNVTISAGQMVTFAGSGSDPDGAPAQFAWVFPGGSPVTVLNNASPGAVTFTTPGTYVTSLTVVDSIGENDPSPPTRTITVTGATTNQPPTANAGGPYTGTAGTAITFTGFGSDPDGTIANYAWNFGDGQTAAGPTLNTTNHTYGTAQTYQVTLTVTDNNGAVGIASTTVTVAAPNSNQLPVARFVYSGTTPTGTLRWSAIDFNGSASSDPDGTIATYTWNFGDGSPATGPSPTLKTTNHTYASAGTYTVTLTVTDDKGGQGSATTTISIYDLLLSTTPDRSKPGQLSNSVSGNIYVFTSPTSGVTEVRFFLDDPTMTRAPYHAEGLAPFDFNGTAGDGTAFAYNTASIPNGEHKITAAVDRAGGTQIVTATFTVANVTVPQPPSAPTALSVQRDNKTKATLTWTDTSGNETGFQIERSTDGTTFTQIATVGANVTQYQDSGVTKAYYYRVRAINSAGTSGYSNTVQVSK